MNMDYYTSAVWSPFKPSLIISGTSNGMIVFHKLSNKSSLKTIHQIERKIENSDLNYPVNRIKFNKAKSDFLTVLYDDGILDIIKLSDTFSSNHFNEVDKLNNILNTVYK
jgi:hypothetical protein